MYVLVIDGMVTKATEVSPPQMKDTFVSLARDVRRHTVDVYKDSISILNYVSTERI